jgi:hypothetical protein
MSDPQVIPVGHVTLLYWNDQGKLEAHLARRRGGDIMDIRTVDIRLTLDPAAFRYVSFIVGRAATCTSGRRCPTVVKVTVFRETHTRSTSQGGS